MCRIQRLADNHFAGWQTSIDRYRTQIYDQLEQIISLSGIVHADNRIYVDQYLSHSVFKEIEQLLRATKSPNPANYIDPELMRYVDEYTMQEESHLERKLSSIAYDLDGPATVSLVTGPGRIERVFTLSVLSSFMSNGSNSFAVPVPPHLPRSKTTYRSTALC